MYGGIGSPRPTGSQPRIASLYAADKKTIASKRRSLQKKLRNLLGHNRRGCVWSLLDRKLLTPAEHQIGEWFDDAVKHARANPPGQLPLRLVPAATLTK